MTDYVIDGDALDRAIGLVRDLLVNAPESQSKVMLASDITRQLIPLILAEVEGHLLEGAQNVAHAEVQRDLAKAELSNVLNVGSHRQSRLLAFFEEVSPAALTQQFLGQLSQLGHHTTVRERRLILWIVQSTIQRVGSSIGLALETDTARIDL